MKVGKGLLSWSLSKSLCGFMAGHPHKEGEKKLEKIYKILAQMKLAKNILSHRTAIVTGAAHGIGEATAYQLACLGANVVIADYSEDGKRVAEQINQSEGHARFINTDLANIGNVQKMIDFTHAEYGKIDIVVNNAAMATAESLSQISVEEWDREHAVNLRAPFFIIKAVLPEMQKNKYGVIVNEIAVDGLAYASTYSSSKFGLRSLTLSLAGELGNDSGIFTFSFQPGVVDTALLNNWIPKLAPYYNMSTEQFLDYVAATNPGYEGKLMPAEHCAASLVYAIIHANEHHGQIVTPYNTLDYFGIIDTQNKILSTEKIPLETSQLVKETHEDFKKGQIVGYQNEILKINRDLEIRIEARTKQLKAAHQELQSRKDQLEGVASKLSKYLSPQIYDSIFTGKKEVKIETARKKLTVFFSDIVSFTEITEKMEEEVLSIWLNDYLNEMADVTLRYQGTLDKFIGDAVMVFFGDPQTLGEKEDALKCVLMAMEMRARANLLGVNIRMGINTGICTVGNFGSDDRMDYTIVGGHVNLASRLESNSKPGEILIAESTYELINDKIQCEPRGPIQVKGIDRNILTYWVKEYKR